MIKSNYLAANEADYEKMKDKEAAVSWTIGADYQWYHIEEKTSKKVRNDQCLVAECYNLPAGVW